MGRSVHRSEPSIAAGDKLIDPFRLACAPPDLDEGTDDAPNHPGQEPVRDQPDLDQRTDVRRSTPCRALRARSGQQNRPNRSPGRLLPIRPRHSFAATDERRHLERSGQLLCSRRHSRDVQRRFALPRHRRRQRLPHPAPDPIAVLSPRRIVSGMKPEMLALNLLDRTIVRKSSVERPLQRAEFHARPIVGETPHLPRGMHALVRASREVDGKLHSHRFKNRPLQLSLHRPLARLPLRSEEVFPDIRHGDLERPGRPSPSLLPQPRRRLTRRTQSAPSRRRRHASPPTWRCGCTRPGCSRSGERSPRTAWRSPNGGRSWT